jgi:hypothetical protein
VKDVEDVNVFPYNLHMCVCARACVPINVFILHILHILHTSPIHPVLVLVAGVDRTKIYTLEKASISVIGLLEAAPLKGF